MGDEPAVEWRPAQPDHFCAGLPLVASRELTVAERVALRKRLRALRLHALLGAAPTVAFAVFFQAIVARPAFPPPGGAERAVILGCMVFGPLLAIAGATLSAFAIQRLLFLYADLRDGRVLRFKGPVPSGALDLGARELTRARLVRTGGTHVLEIVAGSGRLQSVDHEPPSAHFVLGVTSIARGEPASDSEDGHATRALGDDEARELQGHARRFAVTTLLDVVLLALLVGTFATIVTLDASTRVRAPLGIVAFAAAALVFRRLLVAARLTRAVRADAKARTVLVLRPEGDAILELLARSKLPWTRAGTPTRWRTATRRAPARI